MKQSNYAPSILKNIAESINKQLSEISSEKECLHKSKYLYQEALNKTGYNRTPHKSYVHFQKRTTEISKYIWNLKEQKSIMTSNGEKWSAREWVND